MRLGGLARGIVTKTEGLPTPHFHIFASNQQYRNGFPQPLFGKSFTLVVFAFYRQHTRNTGGNFVLVFKNDWF